MALVSINDAAKLVRKSRTTLYRDIDRGVMATTVLQDGDIRIDTADLERAYGPLHQPDAEARKAERALNEKAKLALQQERIRALERVVALEAELRRVKDQVTAELRARLADKEHQIQSLEKKILFLEYEKHPQDVPTLTTIENVEARESDDAGPHNRPHWWARVLSNRHNAGK